MLIGNRFSSVILLVLLWYLHMYVFIAEHISVRQLIQVNTLANA